MKKFLFFIIFSISLCGNAQSQSISVPGTKFSLIPPNGFTSSTSFSGFQNNETGSSIMLSEIPASYQEMSNAFSAEALKSKGMVLLSKNERELNGKDATLFKVSQQANGMTYLKQILMFGDASKTIMVNGIYPEEFKHLEPTIEKSLFSITYNETQNDNPLDAVKFSVDVSNTNFQFAKFLSGALMYTGDGKIPSDKGLLIIGVSVGKFPSAKLKDYAISRLKNLPNGDKSQISQINPIRIDGLEGYEIIATGKNNKSEDEIVYQVMLFDDSEYYIIVGQASAEAIYDLENFKKITRTFKRK